MRFFIKKNILCNSQFLISKLCTSVETLQQLTESIEKSGSVSKLAGCYQAEEKFSMPLITLYPFFTSFLEQFLDW